MPRDRWRSRSGRVTRDRLWPWRPSSPPESPPDFLGTWTGYLANWGYFSIAFLAVAAGALLCALNGLFSLGRRISTPTPFAWGLLAGFLTAFATDLFLTAASGT